MRTGFRRIDASAITVGDTDGDVVLAGSVPSYPQYVAAAAIAGFTDVRGVTNDIQIREDAGPVLVSLDASRPPRLVARPEPSG